MKIIKRFDRLQDFGSHLQGIGARQTTHVRALKGSTFGAASSGKRLSEAERKAIEQLKEQGRIIAHSHRTRRNAYIPID